MVFKRQIWLLSILLLVVQCKRNRNPYDIPEPPDGDGNGNGNSEIVYGDTANANVKMPQYDIPWPSLADSPWPMSTTNPQGLARTSYIGPQNGHVFWAKDPGLGKCEVGPAIGAGGTIYFRMVDSFIALTPEGSLKWRVTNGNIRPQTGLSIAVDSTIYGGRFGFRAFYPDGSVKWDILADNIFWSGRPLIGIDGTIYARSDEGIIFAISPDGNVVWQKDIGLGTGYIVASTDGSVIYAPGGNNTLVAMDASTGSVYWTITTGIPITRGATIDNQGNIYFPGADETGGEFVFSYDAFGVLRWKYPVDKGRGPNWSGINLDYNGFIYTGWAGHGVICLDYEGKFRWRLRPDGYSTDSPILIDRNNDIYIMCMQRPVIYSYSTSGYRRFQVQLVDVPGGEVFPAAVIEAGKIVVGTEIDYLVAIN